MKGKKTSRKKMAEIIAHREMGKSLTKTAEAAGVSTFTVSKYLANQEAYADPRIQEMVTAVKEKEIADLTVLNLKAKARLHEIAPRLNAIESIALMDRTFQQLRLLEGKSTQNIATLTKFVQEAAKFNEQAFIEAHEIQAKDSDLEKAS